MSELPSETKKALPNPFGRVVGDPLEEGIDIPEINREAFEACRRLIEDVRSQKASGALTLFGDAGTGKTHLVGRIGRWLANERDSLFVPVRMDTSARMLWRHVRANLADALLRSTAGGPRALDRILSVRQGAIEKLRERDLAIVLENLLAGRHVRDSEAWLRGQELPESVLDRMGLAQPGPEENQEAASRDVLKSLCSLVEPGLVVFCLDQWEALQSFANDTDGLIAAGQAVSFLHDPPIRNACIVCCVQSGFLLTLEKSLDVAIRDRMFARRRDIHPLDWNQARRLIIARLDEPPALRDVRRSLENPLWPLSENAIRPVFVANAAPARKVISRCQDLFDLWRDGKIEEPKPVEAVLQEMYEARLQRIEPSEAEAAIRNGLPLVLGSLAVSNQRSFDFSLHGGKQQIALCNQANATSLAARLKKIGEAFNPAGGQRLLVLRDGRLRISPSARVTRQRVQSIEEKGGRFVPISQEAVEALAALRRLLADAQSGDLAYRGDPISATQVEQWIAGHLPPALEPLLSELEVPDRLSPRLADLLAERKIISLEEAARELESRPEEVESCARRDPRLFGILGGGTPVLFQLVETETASAG
jgi:hypothetical protein